jgi:drug/metabolite transporter (DMT)-like permease
LSEVHRPSPFPRVALALAAVYLIWGSSYLATRVMVTREPPLFAAGLRFALAGLVLGAFAWWRSGPPRLDRGELRRVLVVALGSILVANGCNVLGARYVPSNVVALLNTTPALFIASLGIFGRRGSPLSASAAAGLALGLAGVVLIVSPGEAGSAGGLLWLGVILAGCLGWSLATLYFRNTTIANPPTMFLSLQMLAGGAMLLTAALLHGEPPAMNWTPAGTAAFLWLTIMSSCLAYSAYFFLAAHTTPVLAGTYAYVNPAIAAVLGWLVLGEALRARQIAGMLVLLAAIALVTGFAGRLFRVVRQRHRVADTGD